MILLFVEGFAFFMPLGRDVLRALRYNPQALQMVLPVGDRRQSGVRVVPQLLQTTVRAHEPASRIAARLTCMSAQGS